MRIARNYMKVNFRIDHHQHKIIYFFIALIAIGNSANDSSDNSEKAVALSLVIRINDPRVTCALRHKTTLCLNSFTKVAGCPNCSYVSINIILFEINNYLINFYPENKIMRVVSIENLVYYNVILKAPSSNG